MKNKYSVKELASILGCSVTAVGKKIKPDPNNPVVKRYRNVYETVVENGITYVLLTDSELEEEKTRSKGFKNVINGGYNTPQNDDIIEIEPDIEDKKVDKIIEFTERYIDNLSTLQKTYYDEMLKKDKQILLLTTSENQKENEYLATKALNTTLAKRNNVLKVALTVVATLLVVFITLYTTVLCSKNKNANIVDVPTVENVQPTVQQPLQVVQQPSKAGKTAKKK